MDHVFLATDENGGSSRRQFIKQAAVATVVASSLLVPATDAFAQIESVLDPNDQSARRRTVSDHLPEGSLLDESGAIHNPPTSSTVARWRSELRNPLLRDAVRKARLHLLLGEYDVAIREQPEEALKHFASARNLVSISSPLYGWAWFNQAFALYMNGQYSDSAKAFNDLLHKNNPHPAGFDRRIAAFRLRHAGACAAQHDALSELGIPRPQKLDVLCAVAGLAVSLRAHKMPYDKRLVKSVTRYTGRGSNAKDIVDACDKLRTMGKADVKAHVLTADEEGLKHLPKPVIAHVEHDHFVTVVEANAKGVVYVCVDCGPWPGGRVELSWEQWRAMQADGYICVVKMGSEPDKVLAKLLDSDRINSSKTDEQVVNRSYLPGIQVAMNPFRPGQPLGSVTELSAMYHGLQGHIAPLLVGGPPASLACGFPPGYPPCPPNGCCCVAGGAGGAGGPGGGGPGGGGPGPNSGPPRSDYYMTMGFGASAGDPVNLATLEEEYTPAPDLSVYNPTGPGILWQRSYRSGRGKDDAYSYNDFGLGWTHNYNFAIYDPSPATVTQPNSATALRGGASNIAATASTAPGSGNAWEIWRSGVLIANGPSFGSISNDWSLLAVTGTPTQIAIMVPVGAVQGTGYEVRTTSSGTAYSALFAVGVPAYKPAVSGNKYLVLPNGARVTITCSALPTPTTPLVTCSITSGQPYLVQMQWNAQLEQADYLITTPDQTQMRFVATQWTSTGVRFIHALSTLTDRVGNQLSFRYKILSYPMYGPGQLATNAPLLIGIDRIVGGFPVNLLTINRDYTAPFYPGVGVCPGCITSISDAYGRSVYYKTPSVVPGPGTPWRTLNEVSQLVATGTPTPPMRYQFTYGSVADHGGTTGAAPILKTITVPSPTGTGTVTATINTNISTGYVTSLVDANGNTTEFVSVDNSGNVVTTGSSNRTKVIVKDTLGNVIYWYIGGFNANMTMDRMIDSSGNTTQQEYYGSASNPIRPTQSKDGMNRSWFYTWDQFGNLLTMQTPRGLTVTRTYDYSVFPLGRLIQEQIGSKVPTTLTYYEPAGLIKTVTSAQPGGGVGTVTRTFTYTALGNLASQSMPGNNSAAALITQYNYTNDGGYSAPEMLGLPLLIQDLVGKAEGNRYDSRGNRTKMTDGLSNTTDIEYNLADQVTKIISPATGQTGSGRSYRQNVYQYIGGPLASVKFYNENAALVRQFDYTYGKEGEFLKATGTPEEVAYAYDALYRLKTVTDGGNNATSYTYNLRGFIASILYPNGNQLQYTSYNAAGQLLSQTDGRGIVTNYLYSSLDGLHTDTQFPSDPSNNIHLDYDIYGQKTNISDAQGTIDYVLDDIGNPISMTRTYLGLPARTLSYTYYGDGTRKSVTCPSGVFNYQYDSRGQITRLANPFSEVTTWSYQLNGLLASQTMGNGLVSNRIYNPLREITSLSHQMGSTTVSAFNAISFDAVGNLLATTANFPGAATLSGNTTYGFDTQNRLTSVTSSRNGGYTRSYGYDNAGNRTVYNGLTRTYNNANQLTGGSGLGSYTYDGNGNPIQDNGITQQFDVRDRLVSVGSLLTAGYDWLGFRAWKQTVGGRRYYLYDGIQPICEMDASGNIIATTTSSVNGVISRQTASGSTFYAFDPHGNIAHRLDSSGAVLGNYIVDAFGQLSGPATTDPYSGFGGQWGYISDSETNLTLCGLRYFNPATGRFLTRDSTGYRGGINLYAYTQNSPLTHKDPLGLSLLNIIGDIVGVAAACGAAFGVVEATYGNDAGSDLANCNAKVACGAAVLSTLVGIGLGPGAGGCFGAVAGAAAGVIGNAYCQQTYDKCHPLNVPCAIAGAAVGAAIGCLAEFLPILSREGKPINKELEAFLRTVIGNALGSAAGSAIGNSCTSAGV